MQTENGEMSWIADEADASRPNGMPGLLDFTAEQRQSFADSIAPGETFEEIVARLKGYVDALVSEYTKQIKRQGISAEDLRDRMNQMIQAAIREKDIGEESIKRRFKKDFGIGPGLPEGFGLGHLMGLVSPVAKKYAREIEAQGININETRNLAELFHRITEAQNASPEFVEAAVIDIFGVEGTAAATTPAAVSPAPNDNREAILKAAMSVRDPEEVASNDARLPDGVSVMGIHQQFAELTAKYANQLTDRQGAGQNALLVQGDVMEQIHDKTADPSQPIRIDVERIERGGEEIIQRAIEEQDGSDAFIEAEFRRIFGINTTADEAAVGSLEAPGLEGFTEEQRRVFAKNIATGETFEEIQARLQGYIQTLIIKYMPHFESQGISSEEARRRILELTREALMAKETDEESIKRRFTEAFGIREEEDSPAAADSKPADKSDRQLNPRSKKDMAEIEARLPEGVVFKDVHDAVAGLSFKYSDETSGKGLVDIAGLELSSNEILSRVIDAQDGSPEFIEAAYREYHGITRDASRARPLSGRIEINGYLQKLSSKERGSTKAALQSAGVTFKLIQQRIDAAVKKYQAALDSKGLSDWDKFAGAAKILEKVIEHQDGSEEKVEEAFREVFKISASEANLAAAASPATQAALGEMEVPALSEMSEEAAQRFSDYAATGETVEEISERLQGHVRTLVVKYMPQIERQGLSSEEVRRRITQLIQDALMEKDIDEESINRRFREAFGIKEEASSSAASDSESQSSLMVGALLALEAGDWFAQLPWWGYVLLLAVGLLFAYVTTHTESGEVPSTPKMSITAASTNSGEAFCASVIR